MKRPTKDGPFSPAPVQAGPRKGLVEGLTMQFLSLGQGAIDVEDQRPCPDDQAFDPIDARRLG